MDYLIREGIVSDTTEILELINELSLIKTKENPAQITIYDLIKDGFSINPLFNTFVAVRNDKIIGFALFYKAYSMFGKSLILEDVFVTKRFKKSGIGLSLFAKFLECAKIHKINKLEWNLLKEFESLIELYKRAGATILWDRNVYRLYEDGIKKAAQIKVDDISHSFNEVIIRDGERKDMPSVLALINELAKYKKTTCNLTIDDLINDGFCKKPLFKTLVLEIDKKVVGFLQYCNTYSTFHGKSIHLEDFFVQVAYRGYNFGKRLNLKLLEYAEKNKIKRLQQLIYDFDKNANYRIEKFYAKKIDNLKIVQIKYEDLDKFINHK